MSEGTYNNLERNKYFDQNYILARLMTAYYACAPCRTPASGNTRACLFREKPTNFLFFYLVVKNLAFL